MKNKYYYKTHLIVSLKTSEYVFGFINISHIPYKKLEILFKDQVRNEIFLFDDSISYIIDRELYKKHQEYLDREIPFTFDFSLFEYAVGLSAIEISKYQIDYYENLPPNW